MKKLLYIGIPVLALLLTGAYFTRPGTALHDFLTKRPDTNTSKDEKEKEAENDAKKIEAHQIPANVTLEFKSGVEKSDEDAMRNGFKIMDFYLASWFGKSITRKISITVDAKSGDNKFLEKDGVMNILWHTNGEEWLLVKDAMRKYNTDERTRISAHEYVHMFQYERGCVRPLRTGERAKWFIEGSAEWLSYKAYAASGNLPSNFDLVQWLSYPMKQIGPSLQPLRKYEGEGRTENIYAYFNLAVNFLMKGQDIKALESLCVNLKTQKFPAAFEKTFGFPLEKFYSDFETYRQNLLK